MLERDPMEDDEDALDEGSDMDEEGEEDDEEEEELEFDGFEDGDEEGEGYEVDEDEQDEDIGLDESSDDGLPEETASLHDPSDEETASEEEEEEEVGEEDDGMDLDRPAPVKSALSKSRSGKKKGGHPVLDDDFFSLADFKAEIEEAEAKRVSRGHLGDDEDDEDEDLESDLDLFAPVDDTNFDEEDLDAG